MESFLTILATNFTSIQMNSVNPIYIRECNPQPDINHSFLSIGTLMKVQQAFSVAQGSSHILHLNIAMVRNIKDLKIELEKILIPKIPS